jgi:hypothetical protein
MEGRDWVMVGGDSLLLRAYRGHALLHSVAPEHGTVLACYRGSRSASPEKDSVLLLGLDGQWRAGDLLSRTPASSSCEDLVEGGRSERWTLAPMPVGVVLARVFETGSYHLVDGALRYRRGEGGRQPLTPETIENGRFLGPEEGGSPLAWEILLRPSGGSPPPPRIQPAGFWWGRVW